MPPVTLFLASSTAARVQAKALATALTTDHVKFLPWWDTFTPGQTLLSELDSLRSRTQGALLVLSPEIQSTIRGKDTQIPNLNVLFEFGFFYGAFGKDRVGVVKFGDAYLPSDLGGYIHIIGSKTFSRSRSVKISKRTTTEFQRWITSDQFLAATSSNQNETATLVSRTTRDQLLGQGRRVISRGLSSMLP